MLLSVVPSAWAAVGMVPSSFNPTFGAIILHRYILPFLLSIISFFHSLFMFSNFRLARSFFRSDSVQLVCFSLPVVLAIKLLRATRHPDSKVKVQ
jgi:hypothetical protein